MDMVVAAGGGERDEAVDSAILEASTTRNDRDVLLNEKLTTDLRPTLFLAQLSNLLAGNISIVHKVTGSSRTFMGEEGAGVAAVETAAARIRSGQSSHMLVGGAFQTEHHDMLLGYELAGYLHRGPWKPVWQRQGAEGGGVISGSGAAFLVLESREHAEKRGRKAYAQLGPVFSDRARRRKDDLAAEIAALAAKAGVSGDNADARHLRRFGSACGDRGREEGVRRDARCRVARLFERRRTSEGSAVPVRRGACRTRRAQSCRLPRLRRAGGKAVRRRHENRACNDRRLSPV